MEKNVLLFLEIYPREGVVLKYIDLEAELRVETGAASSGQGVQALFEEAKLGRLEDVLPAAKRQPQNVVYNAYVPMKVTEVQLKALGFHTTGSFLR